MRIRLHVAIPCALLLATVLLPPGVGAAKSDGAPTLADATLRVETPSTAILEVRQVWEGAAAKSMRQSLDAYFGMGDKELKESDVNAIARATENDIRNGTFTLLTWDGGTPEILDAKVSFQGAVGNITSSDDLVMVHIVTLALPSGANESHQAVFTPRWNGTFMASTAAPGQAMALADGSMTDPGFTTPMAAGTPVTFSMGPIQAAATPTPSVPTEGASPTPGMEATPTPQEAVENGGASRIPGFGAVALVAALAGVALLVARRRS